MIQVLVADDHRAFRADLVARLRREPDIRPVGLAQGIEDALSIARRSRPDVALVDYELAGGNGLIVGYELKSCPTPPRVLIYSAFGGEAPSLAARVAGVDGLFPKSAHPQELFEAIRAVARGQMAPPSVTSEEIALGSARVEREDVPILGLLIERVSRKQIAARLGLSANELDARVRRIVARLVAAA